jgi:hypothetical protein
VAAGNDPQPRIQVIAPVATHVREILGGREILKIRSSDVAVGCRAGVPDKNSVEIIAAAVGGHECRRVNRTVRRCPFAASVYPRFISIDIP